MNDDVATQQLLNYVNSNKTPDITDITETTQFIYFNTSTMSYLFHIREMGYDMYYQETKTGYRVRVLKPNWFSKPMRETMQNMEGN